MEAQAQPREIGKCWLGGGSGFAPLNKGFADLCPVRIAGHPGDPLCWMNHGDTRVGLDSIGRATFEDFHGVLVSRLILAIQLAAKLQNVHVM